MKRMRARVRAVEALLKEHTPAVPYDEQAGLERLRAGGDVPAWAAQVPRPRTPWRPWLLLGLVIAVGASRVAHEEPERVVETRPPVVATAPLDVPVPSVQELARREEAPVVVAAPERVRRRASTRVVPVEEAPVVAEPVAEEPVATAEPRSEAPSVRDPQDFVEMRQVAQAERVLARDPARALALVRAGQAEYPHGYFREERGYLEIVALARLGRRDQARAAAYAFFQDYPQSSYRRRIEDAL